MSGRQVKAGGAFIELSVVTHRMKAGLARAQARLAQFGLAAARAGAMLTGMGVGASIGIAKLSNEFAKFDDQMRAAAGRVGGDFNTALKNLSKEARRLGSTTSFTATEVAKLMGELARAGQSQGNIKKMTPDILNVARATGVASENAAKFVTRIAGAFETEDFQKVGDVLVAAANGSNQSLEELADAFQYVAPIANSTNNSLEDTAAILMQLANNGIVGSRAGTATRALLSQIHKNSEKLAEALGVANNQAGRLKTIRGLMKELTKATKDMTQSDRIRKYFEVFGKLGINAAEIIGKNGEKIDQFANTMRSSRGLAEKLAKAMDSGIGGAIRLMISALNELVLQLGEAFAPSIRVVTDAVRVLGSLLGSVTQHMWIIAPAIMFVVFSTTLLGVGLLSVGFAAIMASVGIGMLNGMIVLGNVLLPIFIGLVTGATGGLNLIIPLLAIGIPGAIATMAVAIGAVIAVGTDWQKMIDDVAARWEEKIGGMRDIIDILKGAVDSFVVDASMSFSEFISFITRGSLQIASDLMEVAFGKTVTDFIKANLVAIGGIFLAVAVTMKTGVMGLVAAFHSLRLVLTMILELILRISSMGARGVSSIGLSISSAAEDAKQAWVDLGNSINSDIALAKEYGIQANKWMTGQMGKDVKHEAMFGSTREAVEDTIGWATDKTKEGVAFVKDNWKEGAKSAFNWAFSGKKSDPSTAAGFNWGRFRRKKYDEAGLNNAAASVSGVGSFSANSAAVLMRKQSSIQNKLLDEQQKTREGVDKMVDTLELIANNPSAGLLFR